MKEIIIDKERGIVAKATLRNVHINNSYLVRKKDMEECLKFIEKNTWRDTELSFVGDMFDTAVFLRSIKSLKAEWVVHNALYNLGIQRERTKDVDLDYPCDKPEWVYKVASLVLGVFCG